MAKAKVMHFGANQDITLLSIDEHNMDEVDNFN